MRRVGRLALRERAIERRPSPPRWRRLLGRSILPLALLLAGLAGTGWLGQRGEVQDAASFLWDRVRAATGGTGPVIADVLVEGRFRTSPEAIATALERYLGRPFLALDTSEVRTRLERLPWVRKATATKLLPGTLHARIEEHAAVALWHDGQRTSLVGADGSLLPIDDLRPFKELKLLHGAGAPEAAGTLLELLEAQPGLAARVTAADRVGGRRWNLYLDGRVEVRLPEAGAKEALGRLAALDADGQLLARAIRTIDLRNPAWTSLGLAGDPALLVPGKGA